MSRITKLSIGMPGVKSALGAALMVLTVANSVTAESDSRPPPLPIEPTGVVEKLPRDYPQSWFLVNDMSFFHMSDGKLFVIDSAAESSNRAIKGMFNISYMGNIAQSRRRGEIYATETFHPRGTRGDRIDVLTIWDKETLSPIGEVELLPGKRLFAIPQRYALLYS